MHCPLLLLDLRMGLENSSFGQSALTWFGTIAFSYCRMQGGGKEDGQHLNEKPFKSRIPVFSRKVMRYT